MIEITICFIFCIFILLKPTLIPYLALLYLFSVGLTSPEFMDRFKVTLGSVNVFPLDFLYALSAIFAVIYFIKNISNTKFNNYNSPETKHTALYIVIFLFFFMGKLINGFLNNMPLDSLVRLFKSDTQVLYFFLPLTIYKDISQLKRLITFTVFISLIFPLCQPFLIHSELTQTVMKGQGTFRLGFGDANIILGLGAISLFCWEYKKYLAFLPLAGIMMLAHRSAYIAIVVSLLALAFLKGKKIQTLALITMAVILVIGMLAALQTFTNINILDKNLSRAEETFKATGTTIARASVITIAIEEVQKRPFTGLEYKELHETIDKSEYNPRYFNIAHPHNFVLSSIMNTGIIGTILLTILISRSLMAAYKISKMERVKYEGAYLFSSILFFVIFSTMNTTMVSVGYVLWFLCGVTYWLLNQNTTS